MPIYAYRCESCGFAKDVLQKMSDAPLTDCPECGKSTFRKQVTAAGFQLKGSGWYVTDFRGGNTAKTNGTATGANAASDGDAAAAKGTSDKAETGASSNASGASEASGASANTAAAPAAAPVAAAASSAGSKGSGST
ncbi:zinc ribbon domain-containing protein [Paraburkholderia acidicola]|uniref:Zinc ribbon domain-containing protein n=1 Tax=Paraburkholderia acidicola TaxID=1912599 RepID=A0ABV1LKH0_9BURK